MKYNTLNNLHKCNLHNFSRINKIGANHEVWHVCPACLHEFDARLYGFECPICGKASHLKRTCLKCGKTLAHPNAITGFCSKQCANNF